MVKPIVYPYIPNSVPEVKKAMLKEIGVKDIKDLYVDIPDNIKFKRRLNLPPPQSESKVKRHISTIMAKNKSNNEMLCFLGAGCWPHYVPAVCDEINARAEFVTTYGSSVQLGLGMHQTIFEFQSMMGELLHMDAVGCPIYDWATACGDAARMAARILDRHEILVPKIINPDRLSVMKNYCERLADVKLIDYDPETGQIDIEDLKSNISSKTAGVYIENPTYLGFIEAQGEEIAEIAHDHGALSIVGVEPSSLGILTPPGDYSADIVCGEGQPLGMHMSYGGGLIGILACRDDKRIVSAMPQMLLTITTTEREGEWGFSWWTAPERSMYFQREKVKSFTGSSAMLWAITAGVYMSLLGPHIRKLGEVIMQKSHYAMKLISEINGAKTPIFKSTHFEEFTVNFDRTGKTVHNVNKALLKLGIQGGKDITKEFPELGESALYCVTEVHTKEDIDKLVSTLKEVVK